MRNANSSKVPSGFYTVSFTDIESFSELAGDLKEQHSQVESSSNTMATSCKINRMDVRGLDHKRESL